MSSSANGAKTNVGRAYEQIKKGIIEGSLAPGTSFSEHQIAAKLEMSRTPVHQALDRLRRDEWVTIEPRSGVKVSVIDASRMKDIYEALSALEGAAVFRLASNSERDLTGIKQAVQDCEDALANDDLVGWANADDAFHRLLLERAGNPQLVRLASSVMEHAHRARLQTVRLRPRPERSNEDHRKIFELISSGKADEATELLHAHRERGISTLVPILDSLSPSNLTFQPT
ncbi:GntR family transcriptional regulator [Corynebacterium lubricantis]|uniref:GntR family transcriptional regulator n=1 Tax=Corynebacterium lubricantis TaxID=541095 RepID=UPI000364BD22|nr:GntR family transcriptional regulator [Corynebacterium lubricantis]